MRAVSELGAWVEIARIGRWGLGQGRTGGGVRQGPTVLGYADVRSLLTETTVAGSPGYSSAKECGCVASASSITVHDASGSSIVKLGRSQFHAQARGVLKSRCSCEAER